MKIPDSNIDLRVDQPSEKIEMVAHSGTCHHCGGIVKMLRDIKTGQLKPDDCICLFCGQRYFVEITGDIKDWEIEQWNQKFKKCNRQKILADV